MPGMIRFGSRCLGTKDMYYGRSLLELSGNISFHGKASIGRGSSISVGKNANLILGSNFCITGSSDIICSNLISFGDHCLLSWDILLMDTDFHPIHDDSGNIINTSKPIKIGNHVWIGCRNTILKGVSIPDNTVVAANSTLTRQFDESNIIIGGNNQILKHGINWSIV